MRHLRGLLDTGPPNELAVLMVDVDHFKIVNDEHGHAEGDRALKAIAETLRGNTRVFDSIARYGGEEFVIVMPGTIHRTPSGRRSGCAWQSNRWCSPARTAAGTA